MRVFNNFLFTFLIIFAGAQTASGQNYFRSVASGNWNSISTWQSSPDNLTWSAAVATPSSSDLAITIQSPYTVTINSTVNIDETTVNLGATLVITGAITLTINNGVGTDLIVNGTVNDNLTTVGGTLTFSVGARWSMSSGATLLKTSGSANNNWQTAYQGGVSTIPATANWILRRTAAGSPPISTTVAGGAFYPNLIIENNLAGNWVTSAGSTFNGSGGFPTIKGNLDIGGSGIGTVDFLNAQTNATPTRILGNVLIRTGNIFRNQGTGIEINGNLTVNGTLNYAGTSKVLFAGGNAQTVVNAPGGIAIYNLEINKIANDVTINKAFTVDNNVNFIQGRFFTTATYPITFGDLATATSYNNSSFISGPCLKTGTNAFTYPVGKGNNVQPIGMGVGAAGLPSPFWTEDFGTGCSQNNGANGTVTSNGTWSVVSTGTNDAKANKMFIGATESGMGAGICGDGCLNNGSLTNRTLHVGNVATSPLAFIFCPTGDCGAAYDAGFGTNAVRANVRAQSPIINCTGKSTISLSFNYMEGGDASDNATLWYYDGVTWTQLFDLNKTTVCPLGQGLWTNYSIILPASANNNALVQVGFNWTNNDDGVGTDPSFAVDDISLSVVSSDVFSAEYFPANPQSFFGNNLEPTLDHISYCEYWDLTRLSGSSNRQVTLTWDNFSCGVNSLNDLRVARYDAGGNIWRDHGNNTLLLTGTAAAGTITSSLISSAYCPYTLASVNTLNPLPVSILDFSLKSVNNNVEISWATAYEPYNHFFTIEKSKTLTDITVVGMVSAKGNANTGATYHQTDYLPFTGNSYYRLKQTDFNGNSSYTAWKAVSFQTDYKQQLNIYVTNGGLDFSISACCEKSIATAKIVNTLGKTIFERQLNLNSSNHLDLYDLSQGIYILIVEADGKVFQAKFNY